MYASQTAQKMRQTSLHRAREVSRVFQGGVDIGLRSCD